MPPAVEANEARCGGAAHPGGRCACGARWTAIFLVRFYQAYIRPHLFGACKFCPTCSEYCIGCLERHGLVRGGLLTARRLLRCHPFAKGGLDPVPPPRGDGELPM